MALYYIERTYVAASRYIASMPAFSGHWFTGCASNEAGRTNNKLTERYIVLH